MIIIKGKNESIFDNHDYINSGYGIVIPINRVGVAGKGLALGAKERFPGWYNSYLNLYKNGLLEDKSDQNVIRDEYFYFYFNKYAFTIISFPTKRHWKESSKIEYIERGLMGFFEKCVEFGLYYIGIPALGCGLGGLNWKEVKRLIIERYVNAEYKPEVICLYPPK